MIQLLRIYDSLPGEESCRVLIDRLWPRGISRQKANLHLWMKEIAPSTELRKWFRHDPEKWEEFQLRYEEELSNKRDLLAELKALENAYGTLTLLYSTRHTAHHHGIVLEEVLRRF